MIPSPVATAYCVHRVRLEYQNYSVKTYMKEEVIDSYLDVFESLGPVLLHLMKSRKSVVILD